MRCHEVTWKKVKTARLVRASFVSTGVSKDMIDKEALSNMRQRMNVTFSQAMGLTQHTATKRAFLEGLVEAAQQTLDHLGDRNFAEEILTHLEIISERREQVDILMRQHCDMQGNGIQEIPEHPIKRLLQTYKAAVERDAPLERLAQASDGPPTLPEEEINSDLFNAPMPPPQTDFSAEDLPF